MAAISDLITFIKHSIRQCPQQTIIQAYARAARIFTRETRWLRVNLGATLTPDVQVYNLGSDPTLEIIGIKAASLTQLPLPATGLPRIVVLRPADSMDFDPNVLRNRPSQFCYIPESSVGFYPLPDKAYPVELTLIVQTLDSATALPDSLLVKHEDALRAGALSHLYGIFGEPWYNPGEAAAKEKIFRSGISNARALVARGYQDAPVRVRPRSFIV